MAYLQWRDEESKVRSKALKTSDERIAQMHLRLAERQEGKHTACVGQALKPRALLRDFLAEKALTVRPATMDVYRTKLEPLVAAWADDRLPSWDRRKFVAYVGKHDWSPRTIEILVGSCKRFIAWAHEQDLPLPDFVGAYRGPKVRAPRKEALTPEHIARLMRTARGHRLELPIALAAFAGLSQADLYDVDWREVDLEAGLIRRDRSKTGTALNIPIAPTLAEVLRRHRAIAGKVCRTLPKTRGSALRSLKLLCKKAGLPPAPRGQGGWHRFRHALGTHLGRQTDTATVGAVLGHRPGSPITLRYMHTDDRQMRRAIDALDQSIQTATSKNRSSNDPGARMTRAR